MSPPHPVSFQGFPVYRIPPRKYRIPVFPVALFGYRPILHVSALFLCRGVIYLNQLPSLIVNVVVSIAFPIRRALKDKLTSVACCWRNRYSFVDFGLCVSSAGGTGEGAGSSLGFVQAHKVKSSSKAASAGKNFLMFFLLRFLCRSRYRISAVLPLL